ncbi:hypothetical protein [Blastochloris sulfoviridis]|uniref:DUF2066 domain-containing protein n=1 Tax=Blastochloris sulfoviridis TaxID=50712 RepID=A0A5M6HUG4_9HYPH|nr:hypothetical protein [Blastochloris sulfoviridis]KAA5599564.1 hypothetical protein F1193_11540 [Blastochloris sulfoviridis]
MRSSVLAAGVLAALVLPSHAKEPAKPAPESVRYFTFDDGLFGDELVDAFLKETRQGGRVVSAELDVCYALGPNSPRKDRFVVALKPEGAKLTGTGQTSEQRLPVAVSLTRKATGKTFSFQGTLTRGDAAIEVDAADLTEQTEEQFAESLPVEETIEPAPAVFGTLSPFALGVKVTRAGLPGVLQALRSEQVRVSLPTLVDSCRALRTGEQVLQLRLAAERAPDVLAKVRALPGVAAAGWTSADAVEWAVRFPTDAWRKGAALDRERLAERLGEVASGIVGARSRAAAWDPTTGELKLVLKRASEVVPSLGLTDVIELQIALGPETPGAGDQALLWLQGASTTTVDEGSGPHLTFVGGDDEGDNSALPQVDTESLLDAFAGALGGQRWDTEDGSWK